MYKKYALFYTDADGTETDVYVRYLDKGIKQVEKFCERKFNNSFDVYIYPTRGMLDKQWQSDWKISDFKSECWMVASGVGTKLDLLSLQKWKTEACEHEAGNRTETQKLLAHELFHVFHGQQNPSPDFSETEGLDWLVEGFATYASEQLDEKRMNAVREAGQQDQLPARLDDLWKGKLKYGLVGSMIKWVDGKYGRQKLLQLLSCKTKKEAFAMLGTQEEEMIKEWRESLKRE